MKNKDIHLRNASFTGLAFVILGYMVKFYPQHLEYFDAIIHEFVRGELPAFATYFWASVTILGNTSVVFGICFAFACFFYWKNWLAELYLILASFVVMGVASTALKYVYQRPRPSLEWLVDTIGYSFPSWHTASTMMVAGVLVIIINQRSRQLLLKRFLQGGAILVAVLVAFSRIYIGVHYATDIIGGWLLAVTLLEIIYPFYDRKRFEWRFTSKQK